VGQVVRLADRIAWFSPPQAPGSPERSVASKERGPG